MRRFMLTTLCVLAIAPGLAAAQTTPLTAQQRADRLQARWTAILEQVVAERGLVLADASGAEVLFKQATRVLGAPDAVRNAYAEAIERLVADPQLTFFFEEDPTLVDERTSEAELPLIAQLADAAKRAEAEKQAAERAARRAEGEAAVAELAATVPREKDAKDASATLTNAAAPKGAERSGFADLVSLALDTKNFVAADKSAVTINLSAFSVLGLTDDTRSAQALYRRYSGLRRLGGAFTFGAKIPEKEITGLSGLPSADDILDAIGWDVKYRVYGDRDARAERWYGLMLGYLGGLNEINAGVIAFVPSGDRVLVTQLLTARTRVAAQVVARRLNRSAQVTFKTGGQHLTNEAGKNKYTFALLADKGLGDNTDVTGNISYAVVDDLTLVEGSMVTLKTWSGAFALKHLVAKDRFVAGRAIELSLDGRFEIPMGDEPLPTPRENVWRAVGAISLPWGDAASIPVSITYASDPNSLTKEKYVTGHIGISYDFGAVKSLFQPRAATP